MAARNHKDLALQPQDILTDFFEYFKENHGAWCIKNKSGHYIEGSKLFFKLFLAEEKQEGNSLILSREINPFGRFQQDVNKYEAIAKKRKA